MSHDSDHSVSSCAFSEKQRVCRFVSNSAVLRVFVCVCGVVGPKGACIRILEWRQGVASTFRHVPGTRGLQGPPPQRGREARQQRQRRGGGGRRWFLVQLGGDQGGRSGSAHTQIPPGVQRSCGLHRSSVFRCPLSVGVLWRPRSYVAVGRRSWVHRRSGLGAIATGLSGSCICRPGVRQQCARRPEPGCRRLLEDCALLVPLLVVVG